MKKIKGFTLIELIIVMAIISILMLGIMQMMRPIRATFIDSTYYESQRNTQNGIMDYLVLSLRYADNLAVYTSGTVQSAINDFKTNVVKVTPELNDDQIHVITIDNKTDYTYEGTTGFHGRIVINKPKVTGYSISDADKPETASARVALSEAYYGPYTYSIAIVPKRGDADAYDTKPDSFDITVASLLDHGGFGATKAKNTSTGTNSITDTSQKFVKTDGYVVLENLGAAKRKECGRWKLPSTPPNFNTTINNQKTYIVFTYPDEH